MSDATSEAPEYTPSMELVRSVFAAFFSRVQAEKRRAQFDRWLTTHDAEVLAEWQKTQQAGVTDAAVDDMAEAIRLTAEYAGDLLPALDGWSWFDALKRHRPAIAQAFVEQRAALEAAEKAGEDAKEAAVGDAVNHPAHYNSDPSRVECIAVARHCTYNIGNAFKYLWRAGLKDGGGNPKQQEIEDLRKAVFSINDEIERLENT